MTDLLRVARSRPDSDSGQPFRIPESTPYHQNTESALYRSACRKAPGHIVSSVRLISHALRRTGSAARILGLTAVMSAIVAAPVTHASTDRVQQASGISTKASKALMLDITRAGPALLVAGDRGYILRSMDQGMSWQQIATPVSTALTDLWFVDEQYGWATGHGGVVLHTRDGGSSWQLQLDGHQINHMTLRFYEQEKQTLENSLDQLDDIAREDAELMLEELEFKLEDAQIATEEGAGKPLLSVWFKDRNQGWVVGAYGMIFHTTDGGQSWQPAMSRVPNPDGFHFNSIGQLSGDTLFMAGEAGTLYRSDNGGTDWLQLDSPYEGSFFGFQWLAQHNAVIAYGLRGNAFISYDQGDSWHALDVPGKESVMNAIATEDQLILLGGSGSVWQADLKQAGHRTKPELQRIRLPRSLPISSGLKVSDNLLALTGLGGIRLINWPVDQTARQHQKQ